MRIFFIALESQLCGVHSAATLKPGPRNMMPRYNGWNPKSWLNSMQLFGKIWEIVWEIIRHRFIKFTKTEKLSGFCKGPRDDSKVKPYRCSRLQMILDRSIDRWMDR
jgi:hypothetical protein